MKVIHILKELKFSGAEIMYVDAAPVFQNKGCELTVIGSAPVLGEYAPYFERAGYKVIHKPLPSLKRYHKRLRYYCDFIRLIKSENYSVVHIHFLSAMWGLALCSWIAKKKSVYTIHAISHSNWYSYFHHCLLRFSAKKIFKCKFQSISDSVYDHELNLYANKTIKIENWYGDSRYYPARDGEKNQIRQELGISNETLVLISVGGCDYNKRHHDIIKSLKLVIMKIPNVLYLHLGKGNTELEEKALVEEMGLTNYIRFCNNQDDVRKFLIVSDLYLMTSRSEGISLTTIEAMACNIPVILYNVPGLRDFNKKGEVSFLIQEDYKKLAEKIIYLHNHPEISFKTANNAKKIVDKYYNMQNNASRIFSLYK